MVLAAGRGERMRPLTDHCPKPLLPVRGKPLLQWQLEGLARAGFQRVVVNTAWLGEQIETHFGSASALDGFDTQSTPNRTQITYSHEGRDFGGALETAGGIVRALPLLAETFWVVAGDVFVPDFQFTQRAYERFDASPMLAHLFLVPNPEHNPNGDFGLAAVGADGVGLALNQAPVRWTFSTIALYRKAFFGLPFCGIPSGNPLGVKAPLAPLLRAAMDNGLVSAELYGGEWTDVGTPQRLVQLNNSQ